MTSNKIEIISSLQKVFTFKTLHSSRVSNDVPFQFNFIMTLQTPPDVKIKFHRQQLLFISENNAIFFFKKAEKVYQVRAVYKDSSKLLGCEFSEEASHYVLFNKNELKIVKFKEISSIADYFKVEVLAVVPNFQTRIINLSRGLIQTRDQSYYQIEEIPINVSLILEVLKLIQMQGDSLRSDQEVVHWMKQELLPLNGF